MFYNQKLQSSFNYWTFKTQNCCFQKLELRNYRGNIDRS